MTGIEVLEGSTPGEEVSPRTRLKIVKGLLEFLKGNWRIQESRTLDLKANRHSFFFFF